MAFYHDNIFCLEPNNMFGLEYKESDNAERAKYSLQEQQRQGQPQQQQAKLEEEAPEQVQDFKAYYYRSATHPHGGGSSAGYYPHNTEHHAQQQADNYWLLQQRAAPAYPEGDICTSSVEASAVQLAHLQQKSDHETAYYSHLPLQAELTQPEQGHHVHDFLEQDLDKLELLSLTQDTSCYVSEFPVPSESLLAELLSVFTGGYEPLEEEVSPSRARH